jgi:hypothetical protein
VAVKITDPFGVAVAGASHWSRDLQFDTAVKFLQSPGKLNRTLVVYPSAPPNIPEISCMIWPRNRSEIMVNSDAKIEPKSNMVLSPTTSRRRLHGCQTRLKREPTSFQPTGQTLTR